MLRLSWGSRKRIGYGCKSCDADDQRRLNQLRALDLRVYQSGYVMNTSYFILISDLTSRLFGQPFSLGSRDITILLPATQIPHPKKKHFLDKVFYLSRVRRSPYCTPNPSICSSIHFLRHPGLLSSSSSSSSVHPHNALFISSCYSGCRWIIDAMRSEIL